MIQHPIQHVEVAAGQTEVKEVVANENILLQTLGFDLAVDHPHLYVVNNCQRFKFSKELARASYFMATNSLHLTTFCLRIPPKIVACVCINLASKWSNYQIKMSTEEKEWFSYVDPTITHDMLTTLTDEFLAIHEKSPCRRPST